MATTKIWPVKDSLARVVDYAENPMKTENPNYSESDMQGLYDVMNYATNESKTERRYYVSGVNCIPDIARDQMLLTKKRYGKEGGNVAFHMYQSFKPGEVAPDHAHQIGIELAKKLWGDRFEVIIATHLNTNCVHNHFVLNSVSFADGKRYNDCKATYRLIRDTSDAICKEHGLSVIENPAPTKTPRNIYFAEKDGKPTRYNIMRDDIDDAIARSMTDRQFFGIMKNLGYKLNLDPNRKYWTIQAPGATRPTRLKTLGEYYTKDSIYRRILANRIPAYPPKKKVVHHYTIRMKDYPILVITGLYGLYLHYCYLLGIISKHNQNKPISPALRAEWRKIHEISAQTCLLSKNKIKTIDQLRDFVSTTKESLVNITAARNKVYNKLRRCTDESQIPALKTERDKYSAAIKILRNDLKLASGIEERSKTIRTNIDIVRTDESAREENQQQRKTKPRER